MKSGYRLALEIREIDKGRSSSSSTRIVKKPWNRLRGLNMIEKLEIFYDRS